ncbi:hypothetical protein HZC35_03830 [Candidatus Saganbacteria bacterium]|nr:hypothetical protein [Candidatus Saganbacteria bacterium]
MDIVLVANSPGELTSLVKPIAEKFRSRSPDSRITLFLTPCQYSSGREVEFAKKNLQVNEVISSEEYKKWVLGGTLPRDIKFGALGAVLFLGGDLLHATLIAKKLGFPAYAYLAGRHIGWVGFYEKFFIPDHVAYDLFAKQDIPDEKLQIVGDLMVDSVKGLEKAEARQKWHLDPARPTLALMPGSRDWEIKHMLPLYEKIVKLLKGKIKDLQTMVIVAPFTSVTEIEKHARGHLFDVYAPLESATAADLALTIPGTNTAHLALLGVPEVMIFPLDDPKVIPLEGLLHYLGIVPLFGGLVKRAVAYAVNKNTKFFALPNIKADRMIIPEFRGRIKPVRVAQLIEGLLRDPDRLYRMSRELLVSLGAPGAADHITEVMLNEALSAPA